jgi:molybdopterin synthase catalytic subunit
VSDPVARVAVRLAEVSDAPLSVDACLAAVADPAAGGTTVFVGHVRDADGGRAVQQLDYSSHPSATARIRELAEAVARETDATAVAAVHRVGRLAVGDLAVVVAASAPHRAEAFAACRRLIEDIKAELPIWKRQAFADGDVEWVGSP